MLLLFLLTKIRVARLSGSACSADDTMDRIGVIPEPAASAP